MRVLVTWGSKRGGTEGIARSIGEGLRGEGIDVDLLPPDRARRAQGFDAVVVGGALYAGRWHADARRFVIRREEDLRRVPVWFFSSGPLDGSAERSAIAPTRQVEQLMGRVGAQGHRTFGGRLLPDARGFPASAMAKTHAGDFRDPAQIRAWAREIARALPAARPGAFAPQPGRPLGRLVLHAAVGWALCALIMGALLRTTSPGAAIAVHAVAAPFVFVGIARHYFRLPGAREPLPAAAAFAALTALLDLIVVAGTVQHDLVMFTSLWGTWLPLALIFVATWLTGEVMSMLPLPLPPKDEPGAPHGDLHPQAGR
jgi:menaquinone-dependent protoporphyrinogen oxidase